MSKLERAVILLNDNPSWQPDFDSIRQNLSFWLEFTNKYGPVEQVAEDLAQDIIDEFDNDITVNLE